MKQLIMLCTFILQVALFSCDFTASPGTYTELSRFYSPDSSKYLLEYRHDQGAWDGGRTSFTTIRNTLGPDNNTDRKSFSSLDFDDIYWQGNDTVVLCEKYTEFKSGGKSKFKDSIFSVNGVTVHVIRKDPIDSTYSREVIFREVSPNNEQELVAYRYVKPRNSYYFLNISVLNRGDVIPKYGNFFIAKYDFDCINDIRWNKSNTLSIRVPSSCYYAFDMYLVKTRPFTKYTVELDETYIGNIARSR